MDLPLLSKFFEDVLARCDTCVVTLQQCPLENTQCGLFLFGRFVGFLGFAHRCSLDVGEIIRKQICEAKGFGFNANPLQGCCVKPRSNSQRQSVLIYHNPVIGKSRNQKNDGR